MIFYLQIFLVLLLAVLYIAVAEPARGGGGHHGGYKGHGGYHYPQGHGGYHGHGHHGH